MAGCKFDVICKHFVLTSFTECVRKDMCKFFAEGDKAMGGARAQYRNGTIRSGPS